MSAAVSLAALLLLLPDATASNFFGPAFLSGHETLSRSIGQLVPDAAGLLRGGRDLSVEVLAPGLVVIRGALSEEEQRRLASSAHRLGRRADAGFLTSSGQPNAASGRGRIYDKSSRLPGAFRRLCSKVVDAARASDDAMPSCKPSHILVNKYTSSKGLVWHRDIYDNDGDGDHPIVNLSVGASCDFGVEVGIFGKLKTVRLRSGDALLFGGPARYVKHAVKRVLLDETPEWMAASTGPSYRLSFTFRQAPSVLGQEKKYRTFDIGRRWFKQTQRAWRPGQPLVACS